MSADPVYRCACSWVGSDPDVRKRDPQLFTCPACWKHDRKRVRVLPDPVAEVLTIYADLEAMIDGAAAHGAASDPDHEVGDLQEILRSCWHVMTKDQRVKVRADHDDIAEWALRRWGLG